MWPAATAGSAPEALLRLAQAGTAGLTALVGLPSVASAAASKAVGRTTVAEGSVALPPAVARRSPSESRPASPAP